MAMFITFPDVAAGRAAGGAGGLAVEHGPHAHGAHARPLYTLKIDEKRFDGEMWFMTFTNSPKIREIEQNPRVVITYADAGKNVYVTVYGQASCEKNSAKAKELWNIHAKGWWPGGPEDPTLTMIRVRISTAEYWDGPSNSSYMLHLLKAVAIGTKVDAPGDHGQVQPR